ncbi:MEMBRANE-ASSOCIATED KINASE REGULATOR 1-RELATED [Salix koriyanagi]|uniref:MEMBRANE-ASSOCIATED KINASE REGULATOR 1-RELATED n=1 Tax=Salix koriyanagi TaxID=2511006 RepID=A0A9Q0WQU8_9ROSI|nr:MEMBRANE-ASSOCIATED KINASE REGULATOR 1-RELATED [Salix koriyanagi]
MGKRSDKVSKRSSQTLPPSPSHSFSSSSSSDFEFTISLSPRKSSTTLCPADELFYKGQLLPLHLSPRISMVRTLLLASSSTSSSSDTTTTASRDSTGSSNDSTSSFTSDMVMLGDCDSSRPSSVTEDDEFRRVNNPLFQSDAHSQINKKGSNKYFSLSRFSSVFKKENKTRENDSVPGSSVKRISVTAKEVIRKYFKKVKPLYEKLSQKQQQKMGGHVNSILPTSTAMNTTVTLSTKSDRSMNDIDDVIAGKDARKERTANTGVFSHSFSGNLRYPRRRSCISSCPSSMRSSPSHSGVLCKSGFMGGSGGTTSRTAASAGGGIYYGDTSSMEELQSAIQGAIAHCKNSMMQNKTMISNEI